MTDYKRDLEGGWDERGKLPGVFFFYDVSPIMVHYTESRTPIYHFITEICAIVGGAVTVRPNQSLFPRPRASVPNPHVVVHVVAFIAISDLTMCCSYLCACVRACVRACADHPSVQVTGMIDSFIYRSHNAITKKLRLGKLG